MHKRYNPKSSFDRDEVCHSPPNCRSCIKRGTCSITNNKTTALAKGIDARVIIPNAEAILREISSRRADGNRIVIDIGSGEGEVIIYQAQRDPHSFFVGIEPTDARAARSSHRIIASKLTNAALLIAPATNLLQNMPDQSVDEFVILFPTPIHKGPINIFCDSTLEHVVRCLTPGGHIYYASDDADTCQAIRDVLEKKGLSEDSERIAEHSMRAGRQPGPKTKFALRFDGPGKHKVPYSHMMKNYGP